ncbi:magnesium transporter MgtE N-terminal domain-containing protein [Paenibacillus koleovorans]|uniref:magnesium transporter MgtE N-terminal domain-containing protein n=1 Tax=Paenibacillus koleovorans TaxID=121608 RepID=UPI000FD78CBE|nr:hypothetical protein [Paenibacillus koleovorans]
MAKAEVEKSAYGAFERLLFFATPIIFTVVLLGVLFALFDQSLLNGMLRAGNKVPVLEKFIPDPTEPVGKPSKPSTTNTEPNFEEQALQLQNTIKQLEASLSQSTLAGQTKDQSIKDLQAQVAALQEQSKAKTQEDAEYKTQVQQLASMYAKMSPSKAAPILENMTLKEAVLILSEMKANDRGEILEKMDPRIAANASIQLKDVVPTKDRTIAALQERLEVNQKQAALPQTVSKEDLGATFSGMDAKSASAILLEMYPLNQTRVLQILASIDNGGRSRILAEMTKTNKPAAAALSSRLAES